MIAADTSPPALVRLGYYDYRADGCRSGTACWVSANDIVTGRPVARGTLCSIARWLDEHRFRPDPFAHGLFKRPSGKAAASLGDTVATENTFDG
tara:strand:- start:2463 stop:2744 length:282 start_codon:yes stop_codon:yes gene_type:complete